MARRTSTTRDAVVANEAIGSVVATVATALRKPPAKARKGKSSKAKRGPRPEHHAELVGAALVVAGILCALGIWLGIAGPAGEAVRDGAWKVLGIISIVLPILLIWGGGLLIRGAHEDRRRVTISVGLVVLAVEGLASLPHHGDAGGFVGSALGHPLQSALATAGAAVVFSVVALGGLLLFTRTTPKAAMFHVGSVARPVGGSMRRGMKWLETIGERDEIEEVTTISSVSPDFAPDEIPYDGGPDEEEDFADEYYDEDEDDDRTITVHVPHEIPETQPDQLAIDLGPAAAPTEWKLPPLSLLKRSEHQEVDQRMVEEQGRTLEAALAAHGVETRLIGATVGPTVTRFELELGPGVKVNRVTSLSKDIAYAMASPDVRILAPIPGRSAIGVEVPNTKRQLVALGDILASEEARRATHPCEVALGRDISGRSVMANLAEMPHILIAGATGAGKSSCINSLVTSLLVRNTPDQLRLILVDPKRVELGQYNGLPHLLTPVVVNPKKAANALVWAVKEMERRYDLLSEVGVRDIGGYNAMWDRGELRTEPRAEGVDDPGEPIYKRLDFIVIVVDELNDLMMVAARDVEDAICRIAQMARAVGIHLVIATQRPSVNVITGVIKANVPARLAFAVSSLADSRVILDQQGAERLIGRGDMLLLGPASSVPRRIQGAWVDESEVRKIVAHWRRQNPEVVYEKIVGDDHEDTPGMGGGFGGGSGDDDDDDALVWKAMELVVRSQHGWTAMVPRKLRNGVARAGRVMDLLEQRGVVGPSTGSKARDVLMTPEELDDLLNGGEN
jgi:S-DNA-T family DNA segregation ATPase FtsK/SpoIIIE